MIKNKQNKTLKAGVIGWPISHSLSPKLHGFWLNQFKINGTYEAIPVKPNYLETFIKQLKNNEFQGINITVPHKETVIKYCDKLSDIAKLVGAVNTITISDDGLITGTNTDVYGFSENLKRSKAWVNKDGVNKTETPAVILGAGGAARGICIALQNMGYSEIRLVNRTLERAEALAKDLRENITKDMQYNIKIYKISEVEIALKDAGLLVNSTSLGMKGCDDLKIDLTNLPKTAIVNDIIYNPLETKLLKAAKLRGNPTVTGIGMLFCQAIPGFEAWFKPKTPPKIDQNIISHILKDL